MGQCKKGMICMKFAKNLYLTEDMAKKKRKVIRQLKKRKLQFPVFVLALCHYGKERMEIVSSLELLQKNYPDEEIFVAGIAGDYDGALLLVEKILKETLRQTEGTDICSYIHDREREK